jgi:hypothetical protein
LGYLGDKKYDKKMNRGMGAVRGGGRERGIKPLFSSGPMVPVSGNGGKKWAKRV